MFPVYVGSFTILFPSSSEERLLLLLWPTFSLASDCVQKVPFFLPNLFHSVSRGKPYVSQPLLQAPNLLSDTGSLLRVIVERSVPQILFIASEYGLEAQGISFRARGQ